MTGKKMKICCCLLLLGAATGVMAKDVYAVRDYSDEGYVGGGRSKVTFYYDDNLAYFKSKEGVNYENIDEDGDGLIDRTVTHSIEVFDNFFDEDGKITSSWPLKKYLEKDVAFDASFADFRPKSTANWFSGQERLTVIEGLEYINTSEVTDMSSMFANSPSLPSVLDLSTFDTSNVTDMSHMFEGSTVDVVGLTHFDTSNVTDMSFMFYAGGFGSPSFDDLSHFNTSKVTNMAGMFSFQSGNIDIRNFDVSNVANTEGMFYNCFFLKTLVLPYKLTELLGETDCESIGSLNGIPCILIVEGDYRFPSSMPYFDIPGDVATTDVESYQWEKYVEYLQQENFEWKGGLFKRGNLLVTENEPSIEGDQWNLAAYNGIAVDINIDDFTPDAKKWKTVCFPFDLSAEQLQGFDVEELSGSTWSEATGILTLNFTRKDEIAAGKPYLVRAEDLELAQKSVFADEGLSKFKDVVIDDESVTTVTTPYCSMVGSFTGLYLEENNKHQLYLSDNQFYYPSGTVWLPAMKCYFTVSEAATHVNAVSFDLDAAVDGIIESVRTSQNSANNTWYSIQGIETSHPQKGVYIRDGKKIVVK